MTTEEPGESAISLLQELGLQEYEARCFLAVTQLSQGTAKEIHEVSEVPRTRVYDALRVLESKGLVEVQHSSPQVYRSVGIDEATETLRQRYESRIDTLEGHLNATEPRSVQSEDERLQEVWSLSGHEAIESRTRDLVDEATGEISLLVVDEALLSDRMIESLNDAVDHGVAVTVGGVSEAIADAVRDTVPGANVFETPQEWIIEDGREENVGISRVLLVDGTTLLVGSFYPDDTSTGLDEQAVFARGIDNGLVVLVRRFLSMGVPDPGDD